MADRHFIIIPEATENIFTNPSFENDLTGYDTIGTWSAVTTDQFFGAKCAKCTVLDTGEGQIKDDLSVSATTYTLSAMIKRSGGGAITSTQSTSYFNSTENNWTTIQHIQDGWYLCTRTGSATAGSRSFGVRVFEADMMVDALQLEQKAYATTYCDGDFLGWRDVDGDDDTVGYAWSGTAHASTSTRHAQERSGGRVYDILSLGVSRVNGFNGFGPPDPQHQITRYALLPGAQYKGMATPERIIDLPLTFVGTSFENWHDNRLLIVDATSPNLVYPNQPFTFRYSTGDATPKWLQIDARYAGGLPGSTFEGQALEQANLRMLVVNPYWRRLKQEVTSLTVNTPTAVTNGGYLEALPRLVIEGEGSIDSLVNSTTGQTLEFNFFINTGQRFILDLEAKTIIRKTGSTVESILYAHTGGRINLWWLQRGSNTVQVTASASGTLVTESGDTLLTESGDTLITSSTLSITKCQIEFYETFETADGIGT